MTAAPSTPATPIPTHPLLHPSTVIAPADFELLEVPPVVVVEAEHSVPFFELSMSTLGWPLVIPIESEPSDPTVKVLQETASMTVVPELQEEEDDGMVRFDEVEEDPPRLERMEMSGGLETSSSVVERVLTFIWTGQR
jgi:hypothetical protein